MATVDYASAASAQMFVRPLGFFQSNNVLPTQLKRRADDELADWSIAAKRRLEAPVGGAFGAQLQSGPLSGIPDQQQTAIVHIDSMSSGENGQGEEISMDVGQTQSEGEAMTMAMQSSEAQAFQGGASTAMETSHAGVNSGHSSQNAVCQRCLAGDGGHFKHILLARHFQDDSLW